MSTVTYEAWNKAIAEFFYDGRHAHQPVYLQIDRETLADLGLKAGVTPGDEEQSFTEAVKSKLILPGRIDPFRLFQGMTRAWTSRLRQNPLDPPPFLGLLGVCVLAASRMASDPESGRRSTNYYVPLNKLLGLDNRGEPPGFRWVTSLWGRLNSWLEETNGGAHLVFFCRGTGPSPDDGVHFVSCDGEVMPWLDDDDSYARAMFRV